MTMYFQVQLPFVWEPRLRSWNNN